MPDLVPPHELAAGGAAPHTGAVASSAIPSGLPDTPALDRVPEGDQRPRADRFMRSLLRIEGGAQPGAVFGAQKAMRSSILVSAVRCTITYLLVPLLTPVVGVLDLVAAPVSLVLCAVAVVMSTRSMRRFWLADHPKRWHYTALVLVVWAFLAVALVRDVAQLT